MSGPKVVRVRTREERTAECLALIDRLQASIEQVEAFERHHDRRRPDVCSTRALLLADLKSRVAAGSFDEVERIVPKERDKVIFEREELERVILEEAASLALRRRRTQLLADALGQRWKASGRSPPAALSAIGSLLSTDEGLEKAEQAVGQMLGEYVQAAAPDNDGAPTQTQRQLASALSPGESIQSLTDWVARQASQSSGDSLGRLERVIAEAAALDTSESGVTFLSRAKRIKFESDPQLQARQIDSLLLEWPTRRRKLKEHAATASKARELLLTLSRDSGEEAKRIAARFSAALSQDTERLAEVISETERDLAAMTRSNAAKSRREAVLRGLRTLGYEIGSNLNTATPKAGRMVVRKPDREGYGVELMVPEGAERVQVKVVAIAGECARDRTNDRKAETSWCSDFSTLQVILKKEGTEVAIEHALGVGVAEMTEVSIDDDVELAGLAAADLKRP
jgi:hypothetical protein